MPRKRQKDLRNTILSCAEKCFREKGYAETTMRDISNAAGISPGAIYNYFRGKKDLFETLDIPEAESLHPQFDSKKNRVLQTALFLFGEKGYNGVTMDSIASTLNISKSSLYQYCSSKEDLFSQILQSSSFNLYTQNLSSNGHDIDIRETIKSIGKSYIQIGDNPQRSSLLKTVIKDSAQFPELGKLYYSQGIKPACTNIMNYIKHHCRQQGIPFRNPSKLFAFILTYVGSLQSYILMNSIISGIDTGVDRDTYLESTTDIFINYLKTNHYI